jgi:hypothetical protein
MTCQDIQEKDYYVWQDESFSPLSILLDVHNQGFKFILANSDEFLKNWFKENNIPLQNIRYTYDPNCVFFARIMCGEDSYGLTIVSPKCITNQDQLTNED